MIGVLGAGSPGGWAWRRLRSAEERRSGWDGLFVVRLGWSRDPRFRTLMRRCDVLMMSLENGSSRTVNIGFESLYCCLMFHFTRRFGTKQAPGPKDRESVYLNTPPSECFCEYRVGHK